MKNKRLIIFFIFVIVIILSFETYIYVHSSDLWEKEINITFLVTGDNLDKWENMQAGAETAAIDKNCIIDFVNSPIEYGVDGEIDNLNRIIEEGADYVMVATTNYEEMFDYVQSHKLEDKVIFVKNGTYSEANRSVMADDYKLGADFADYILQNSTAKKLMIVSTNEDFDTMETLEGLESVLESSSIKIEYRLMSATSGTLNKSIYNLGLSGIYDGFITLDFETMEAAAKAQDKLNKKMLVYSIDSSKEAVYYLDSDALQGLAFLDEYSMGYLAVDMVLDNKSFNELDDVGKLYYISDRQSIHSEKMEKVLFPFVK